MKHSYTTLLRRLSRSGFKKDFVESAILPDWWDISCSEDPSLLRDLEVRSARFLNLPLAVVRDPRAPLAPPAYPEAQLRRVRNLDRDRLRAAILAATRVAEAVVRNLKDKEHDAVVPPSDALSWRGEIERTDSVITLRDIAGGLWKRGIPIVPLDVLPTPSFQGMCCVIESRPVILLGHKHDEPGRVAFLIGHEAGHIAAGDCKPDRPVVDEEEEITDEADIERLADQYATRVLIGDQNVPEIDGDDFKEIARRASELEEENKLDASMVIFAWARRTGDYATATMAVRALYRHMGARAELHDLFDQHVDISAAAETDQALLRCVKGNTERVEAVG